MRCPKCVLTDMFTMCSDQMSCLKCVLTDMFTMCSDQMSCLKCLLTDVFTNVFWPNVCPKMLNNRCAYKCVLTKWVVSNAYLQMCLQMCSDQMICIKCVLTDVFTNLAHHRDLRTCFPKETKRRERSKTYFSSPQKSLLKRILAAIGALYVGIGMGLVMGMGWDEGGGLCLL